MPKTRRPPANHALARELRALADALDRNGRTVDNAAPVLAARGFPSGGTTSAPTQPKRECQHGDRDCECGVTLTSVEAAASRPGHFDDIDTRWDRLRLALWDLTGGGQRLIADVVAHADRESSERKVRRPGAGICTACGRDVPGTSTDRLRSGWCDACRKAWERADRPDRMAFERRRYAEANPPDTITVDPTDPLAVACQP